MPDPSGPLPTVPGFGGYRNISPDLEARLRQQASPNPNTLDKTQLGVIRVAALTTVLGYVRVAIPGRAGGAFGTLISGTGRSATGAPTAGPSVAGNFAPAPLGYMKPSEVGVPPNFYLPAGSSQYIPSQLDVIGLGLAEQRVADAAADADRLRRLREEATADARANWAAHIAIYEPAQPAIQPFVPLDDAGQDGGGGEITDVDRVFAANPPDP